MRKIALLTLVLITAGCQDDQKNVSLDGKVTLRTLNSNNDLQICYNPLSCFFTPQTETHNALEFLYPEEPQDKLISKNNPLQNFSPMAAQKVAEIKKMVQKPVTITAASRNVASVKKTKSANKSDAVDFKVEGVSPEQLKTYCQKAAADSIRVYEDHIRCAWNSQPISMESEEKPLDLQVSGELHKGQTVTLQMMNTLDKESSEKVFVAWDVQHEGNPVVTSKASTLILKDLKPGLYKVKAQVGGTQEENVSLIVE